MKVDIYRSSKKGSNYISVPSGTDISKVEVPDDVEAAYGQVHLVKKDIDLQSCDKRIAIDSGDVIRQIEEKGFALHGGTVDSDIT